MSLFAELGRSLSPLMKTCYSRVSTASVHRVLVTTVPQSSEAVGLPTVAVVLLMLLSGREGSCEVGLYWVDLIIEGYTVLCNGVQSKFRCLDIERSRAGPEWCTKIRSVTQNSASREASSKLVEARAKGRGRRPDEMQCTIEYTILLPKGVQTSEVDEATCRKGYLETDDGKVVVDSSVAVHEKGEGKLVGTIGKGEATLTIHVGSGDITIK